MFAFVQGLPRKKVQYVVAGLITGPFLAVLDQTMVSVALPQIVAEMGRPSWYAWVKVSYLLFSTIAAPVFGRLSEILPRKPVVMAGFFLYVGGSVLCALAPAGVSWGFIWLMGARAVQGMGGGALFALAFTTLAWFFSPRERSRWAGLIGAVLGLAAAIGPPAGGLITQYLGWRWTFWVNVPGGGAALLLIARFLPELPAVVRGRFDWAGAVLLAIWASAWLLALSAFESQRLLSPATGMALMLVGLLALLLWVRTERCSASPLFDLSQLRVRSFRYAAVAAFWFGPLFFGGVTFLPLYLQKVLYQKPVLSGAYLLILTAVSVVSTGFVGAWVSRHGRYRHFLMWGGLILAVLFGLAAVQLPSYLNAGLLGLVLGLLGIALGPFQALLGVIAQNDVPAARVGTITSAVLFARQMGATWGLAALNALYSYRLGQTAQVQTALQSVASGMALVAIALLFAVKALPDTPLRPRSVDGDG